METTVARFDGTLCEQWWPLLYSFSKLLTYIGIMQWDKNRFQKNITTKTWILLQLLPCVTPQKKYIYIPCTSHGIRKECIKETVPLTRVRHFKTGTIETKCGGHSNKTEIPGENFFFPHYLFLEIRRRVVKSISDTPCLSMCCCILCWDSLFNEEFHFANRTR